AVAGANAENVPFLAILAGGSQEHAVAPNDRRGVAAPWQRGLPRKILCLAPLEGHVRIVGVTLAAGAAPLMPLVRRTLHGFRRLRPSELARHRPGNRDTDNPACQPPAHEATPEGEQDRQSHPAAHGTSGPGSLLSAKFCLYWLLRVAAPHNVRWR